MNGKTACWAVTGGTGLLGNNLIRVLLARGVRVRALVRGKGRRELAGLAVEEVEGDLDDPEALRRCFAGADVVVHSAAMVWVGKTRGAEMARVNVEGTRNVVRALPPGARLVQVSTVDALGWGTLDTPSDEDTPRRERERGIGYGDTKEAADSEVRAGGIDHVIVYPCYMLGAWDWRPSSGQMILEVARGKGLLAPPGSNNFVHVRDVCEGILAAAGAPSGSRWILGNENLSYRDVWTKVAQVTGARPPMGSLPRWLGVVASAAMGVGPALGLEEGPINAVTARFGFEAHCFDPGRARRELNLPATPVEEAIAEAWAWFQANGYT